mmetsp:Transcript_105786/g.306007  ORF Transcript_105786/g.306007 Transcript_105786/m.306007 type:complete len:219 (-) Transcript_105786:391-1047(-)
MGCGNKWPKGSGSSGTFGRTANAVSEVPRLMAMSPGETRPLPTTAQGLSPDHMMIWQVGEKPNLLTQYSCTLPATSQEARGSARTARRSSTWPGATNSRSRLCQPCLRMSIRFIPAASETSMGTMSPTSKEAPKELTNDKAPTSPKPCSAMKRRKKWHEKRSCAVEPVISATLSIPPLNSASSLQLLVVLVSIHTGDASTMKALCNCSTREPLDGVKL